MGDKHSQKHDGHAPWEEVARPPISEANKASGFGQAMNQNSNRIPEHGQVQLSSNFVLLTLD